MEWIEKYLHTKPEDLDRARRFMGGRGAWMGLFSCIPVIGDVITIVLGLMRANLTIFIVSVTISKLARYVVLMVTAGALFSCSSPKSSDDTRVITVSIEPLRYLTEQIVGDRFEVVTMVPKGSSPETYEPTARQMTDLSESILYIKVGNLGFERTWMPRLTANATTNSPQNSKKKSPNSKQNGAILNVNRKTTPKLDTRHGRGLGHWARLCPCVRTTRF